LERLCSVASVIDGNNNLGRVMEGKKQESNRK